MNRFFILVCLLIVGIAAGCGSTNNEGVAPAPERETNQTFSVSAVDGGVGTFTPVLSVVEDSTGATVTVSAENAQDVAAAYVNVQYDGRRFSPATVEVGSFLGNDEEVISLSITDQPNSVPVGIAQIANSTAAPVDGSGVIAVLRFDARPFSGNRGVSQSPKGTANAVADLQITGHVGDDWTLQWTEKNQGDYNNDSLVGIADLTPLGALFGQSVSGAANEEWARLVDGNGDGLINIQDITPIGANFGNQMGGYILYVDNSPVGSGITVPRSAQFIDPQRPVRYNHVVSMPGAPEFIVRPAAPTEVQAPGPPSNPAVVNIDTEAPVAPSDLTAGAGETIGNRTVRLSFTPSTSSDTVNYEIERKLSIQDDEDFTNIATKSKDNFEKQGPLYIYLDVNPSFTDASYDYRVRAVDGVGNQSLFSNTASATPFVPAGPAAPTNPAAVAGQGPQSIDLSFNAAVANDNLNGILAYRIYRQAPGEGSFGLLNTISADGSAVYEYNDGGLTEGEDYSYYFTSVAAGPTESEPSSTVVSQCSVGAPIQIIEVTTDKTTHYKDGDNGVVSNLEVICDTEPTSVEWEAEAGTIEGDGTEAVWTPAAGMAVGPMEITVTVNSGAESDSATITLRITSETIKLNHVDRGGGGNIPVGTNGHYNDLALTGLQYLAPLAEGGAITDASGNLSDYVDGKVWLMDYWELWCGPCRGEFAEIDDYAENYSADGYIQVSLSNDNRPQYNLANIKGWYENPVPEHPGETIDYCYQFFGYNTTYAQDHGYDFFIPYNLLFDADGNCRRTGGQAFGWDTLIAELCGVAVK